MAGWVVGQEQYDAQSQKCFHTTYYIPLWEIENAPCHIKGFKKSCIKESYLDLFPKLNWPFLSLHVLCINKFSKCSGLATQEQLRAHFSCAFCGAEAGALNSF